MARIGIVFGRASLDGPRMLYMPFAMSTIKKLMSEGHEIDVFLCERRNFDYQSVFNGRVRVFFLDHSLAWKWGRGKALFILLNLLFFKKALNESYSSLWGIGLVGSSLAGRMASLKRIDYYYMSDEFPDTHYLKIWVNAEKRFARKAKKWIVPDESRVSITTEQIQGLTSENAIVLPNAPLIEDLKPSKNIDWHNHFKIPRGSEIVLYAGGIDRENNIELLLSVFPFSSTEFYLLIIGGDRGYARTPLFRHPRIIWTNDRLSDEDLFSLHQSSLCVIAFYSSFGWLEYVGKSSGKIMRAVMAGCPVVATNFQSCYFIKEHSFGVLIDQPHEIVNALIEIKRNKQFYQENILNKREKVSFERYWRAAKLLH